MNSFNITNEELTLDTIQKIISDDYKLSLSDDSVSRINKSRKYLDSKLSNSSDSYYGINTGFGALYNHKIKNEDLHKLQENLVMSHACGVGNKVSDKIVQLMLLLKIHSLSLGYSGVQLKTIELLISFYNNKVYPVVYEWGSLGASGDLAPLAHLSLSLIGMGEVSHKSVISESDDVLKLLSLEPIELKAKEGLALINGTQFITAIAVHVLLKLKHFLPAVHFISASSLDAFDCSLNPFDNSIQKVRSHKGQTEVASIIRKLLNDSQIANSEKEHLQDPYSFRCIPQVHGASIDAIKHLEELVSTEVNSVTDNPILFAEEDKIISGGNFHAQPLAIALDYLCIAIAELGSISERRTYQLISGKRGLPSFLISIPGINSGLMIPQYTAASLVSRNRLLCGAASADSMVSSNGQEDHVSMGAHAAIKCLEILDNVYSILSIELMTASQALSFRSKKTSSKLKKVLDSYQSKVKKLDNDRPMYVDIKTSKRFLQDTSFNI